MFGIGFSELVVIAIVALIFVGPKRLPEVMKQAGKFFVHVRRTANDVRGTFDQVVREAEDEIRKEEAEHLRTMLAASAPKPVTTVQAIESGTVVSGVVKPEATPAPAPHAPDGTQPLAAPTHDISLASVDKDK